MVTFAKRLRPSTKFEVRRPSRSEDTAHLVCQLSIYNSFPVIRTTIAKNRHFYVPRLHFLFALGTPLQESCKTLHEWKDNSVLAKPLTACTHHVNNKIPHLYVVMHDAHPSLFYLCGLAELQQNSSCAVALSCVPLVRRYLSLRSCGQVLGTPQISLNVRWSVPFKVVNSRN